MRDSAPPATPTEGAMAFTLASWAILALTAFWLLEHYTDWRR
jgi:hypothetical protein